MKKFIGNFDIAVDGIRNIDGRNFHIVRILCYGDTNIEKEYYLTYSTIKELSDRAILVKILHFPEGSILNIKQGRIWKVTRKNAEKGEKTMEFRRKNIIKKDNNFYTFAEKNAKGECITFEISLCKNTHTRHSLADTWYKLGLIPQPYDNYWSVETYVHDTEGNCFGLYNPQDCYSEKQKRNMIDFRFILPATEENKEILIQEIYKRFMAATGETATERKIRAIREYAAKCNVPVMETIPEGWEINQYAIASPEGSVWISNLQPLNSGQQKSALLLI